MEKRDTFIHDFCLLIVRFVLGSAVVAIAAHFIGNNLYSQNIWMLVLEGGALFVGIWLLYFPILWVLLCTIFILKFLFIEVPRILFSELARPLIFSLASEGKTFTVDQIEAEPNVEIRRNMIERYGEKSYIKDCGAVPIDYDEKYGTLFKKGFEDDDPIVMVRVKNSTKETTGKSRVYYLRVPPEIETARAAVAWTFGMTEEEYAPEVET